MLGEVHPLRGKLNLHLLFQTRTQLPLNLVLLTSTGEWHAFSDAILQNLVVTCVYLTSCCLCIIPNHDVCSDLWPLTLNRHSRGIISFETFLNPGDGCDVMKTPVDQQWDSHCHLAPSTMFTTFKVPSIFSCPIRMLASPHQYDHVHWFVSMWLAD